MTDAATTAVLADFRDVDAVLAKARQLLDFSQPVAVVFVASLRHVSDDDPAGVVGRYLDAVVPGSCGVICGTVPPGQLVSLWAPRCQASTWCSMPRTAAFSAYPRMPSSTIPAHRPVRS